MYIFKNAFRSLVRAKGRNILIALIVLVLSVSSCIGLSIKQSNNSLKEEYASSHEITATLTSNARGPQAEGVSLETLKEYGENKAVKDFSYSASLYFSASEGIEPLDVAGSFKQNQDFRDKYGDIKNGETITSSSTTTTTSESDETAEKSGSVITLSNNSTGKLLMLNNESIDSISGDNTSSQSGDSSQGSESTGSDTTSSEPQDDTSSEDTTTSSPTESAPQDSSTPNSPNMPQGDGNNQNDFTPPDFSGNTESGGNQTFTPPTNEDGTVVTPPTNEDGTITAPPSSSGKGGKGDTFINNFTNNQYFFNMASMNDFTVVGYNSNSAMPDYVSELSVLDLESDELNCVISKSLAEENEIEVGDTFQLANPDNEEETYKFTVVGICDTTTDTEGTDTSSNASYTDNNIHVSGLAIERIVNKSAKENKSDDDKENALTPTYSGTYTFNNLTDYETLEKEISETDYTLVSEDVENYEKSVEQLDTLGGYATYFLIVIFVIGAVVLIIINLFSIRDRKYEIGVLTAIGMKKQKVAMQFVIELFCITFAALIIGSGIGAVSSVPVTNSLLTAINTKDAAVTEIGEMPSSMDDFEGMPNMNFGGENGERPNISGGDKGGFGGFMRDTNNYIASVSSATDLTVIGQMILVGLGLTLISALSAVLFVMRYEPLKILSNRE